MHGWASAPLAPPAPTSAWRNDSLDDVLLAVERLGPPVAVLDLPEGIAGAYLCRPAGRVIFVNRIHAVQRQRFTLAHQLGHHRLDHPPDVDRPQDLADFSHDPVEVQANWFAAEFLMAMDAARRWAAANVDHLATLEDVVRFACAFGVSARESVSSFATRTGISSGSHRPSPRTATASVIHAGSSPER